jgi:hypothetical protein
MRVLAPARILLVFVRRTCHVLNAPTRVPMIPIHTVPRRRVSFDHRFRFVCLFNCRTVGHWLLYLLFNLFVLASIIPG